VSFYLYGELEVNSCFIYIICFIYLFSATRIDSCPNICVFYVNHLWQSRYLL